MEVRAGSLLLETQARRSAEQDGSNDDLPTTYSEAAKRIDV
jgi:hypothetical protein